MITIHGGVGAGYFREVAHGISAPTAVGGYRGVNDYVAMCEAWFNTSNGMNLVLNRQQDGAGSSFWYELFPHIVFYALADRYSDKPRLPEIMRITADRWRQVCLDLADTNDVPDFNHLSFDFRSRKPVDNGRWREPDAAVGVAWLEYAAWKQFHDSNLLTELVRRLPSAATASGFSRRRRQIPFTKCCCRSAPSSPRVSTPSISATMTWIVSSIGVSASAIAAAAGV